MNPTHRCARCGSTDVALAFRIWIDMPVSKLDLTREGHGYEIDWVGDDDDDGPEGDPERGFCAACGDCGSVVQIDQVGRG